MSVSPTADCRLPNAEAEQRAAAVEAARSWIGTPYHHAADVRGAGVDCAMILVRVYVDLGLVDPFDPRPYPPDWMFHRDDERYLGFLLARASLVDRVDASPGDVILFRFGRCFSHGGIVTRTAPLKIVHAFAPARRVVEEDVCRGELGLRLAKAKFASFWR